MSLALSIGFLADLVAHDPEGAAHWRKRFAAIKKLLRSKKLEAYDEPERIVAAKLPPYLASFPSEWGWKLRRAMAYVDTGTTLTRCGPGKAFEDSVLQEEQYMFSSHLISLSATTGVFVPISFGSPIPTKEAQAPGGFLGSSQQLAAELEKLAPAIGIKLTAKTRVSAATAKSIMVEADGAHAFWAERKAWLSFHVLARASIEHRTALVLH